MEKDKDIRKKLIIPFLFFIGAIVVSINSICKGIAHHETWRIVLASIGAAAFVAFVVLIVYTVVKNERKAA